MALSNWDMQCIADSEKAIARYEALIGDKMDHEMVRSLLGDSRPRPVSYFKQLISDNRRQIARIQAGE